LHFLPFFLIYKEKGRWEKAICEEGELGKKRQFGKKPNWE
jgi:hypothetical protein